MYSYLCVSFSIYHLYYFICIQDPMLMCVDGRGRISRSALTQDIEKKGKMCIQVRHSQSMDSTTTGRPSVCIL